MVSRVVKVCAAAAVLSAATYAQEGAVPDGIPHLDHVFVLMMENHGYSQIVDNPQMPFTNQYMKSANAATNYFAVAHPSLTNYLEAVGGSNFGVTNDNSPDWHSTTCVTNLATGKPSLDNGKEPPICPIAGVGADGATPVIDYSNETSGPPGDINIDGTKSYAANHHTVGKTIADQIAARGMTWKAYEESLTPAGADNVNESDGLYTDKTDLTKVLPGETTSLVGLYAVKHDPFAYFKSVQDGTYQDSSLKNIVSFDGKYGLFEDLKSGHVPTYSFIAPNQCDDQHGRSNAGPQCESDPNDNGTQQGLNRALMYKGDKTIELIVGAIHESPVWREGRTAIVVIWDENDYSTAPVKNRVLAIVDTNYGKHGVSSSTFYTHFSLLKSIESGLGLPCLNHACDSSTALMTDLFAAGGVPSDAGQDQ
jgi:hypothetical protein